MPDDPSPIRPASSLSPASTGSSNGVPSAPPASAPAPRRSLWQLVFGSAPAPATGQPNDSFREIVETIVFVVVLVLMLKSFAAEAFVIPTGSMAETLWGYQKVVECPECHLKFPINCSREVDPTDGRLEPVTGCTCPNCRKKLQFPSARQPDPSASQIPDPGWSSGDRVLVAKFVYDLVNRNPDRLDVVVFKYPGDASFPLSGPHKSYVPMNYIKRLIGLPGETIAIHGGNLYVLDPEGGPSYKDYEKAKKDPRRMATLWQYENMHVDEALPFWNEGKFQILRKPPDKVLSTMRLVYDNDHQAKGLPARWTGDGWSPDKDQGFVCDAGADHPTWLRYHHLLRGSGSRPSLITDFLGYNTFEEGGALGHSAPQENWVNDLVLECEVTLDRPEGELILELSRGVDRFQARWDLSSGVCSLYRMGQEKPLDSRPTALHKKGTYRLRFADVDEQLLVWVDGSLPFNNRDGQGVTFKPPENSKPTEENDFEPASVGVQGSGVHVRKLRLFRDLYYTTGGNEPIATPGSPTGSPSKPDVPDIIFTDPSTWAPLAQMPTRTYYVQPEHFLCLGDNSQESSDGRSWGLVPRRLLLGRAVLIYYPLSRAGRIH